MTETKRTVGLQERKKPGHDLLHHGFREIDEDVPAKDVVVFGHLLGFAPEFDQIPGREFATLPKRLIQGEELRRFSAAFEEKLPVFRRYPFDLLFRIDCLRSLVRAEEVDVFPLDLVIETGMRLAIPLQHEPERKDFFTGGAGGGKQPEGTILEPAEVRVDETFQFRKVGLLTKPARRMHRKARDQVRKFLGLVLDQTKVLEKVRAARHFEPTGDVREQEIPAHGIAGQSLGEVENRLTILRAEIRRIHFALILVLSDFPEFGASSDG